MKRQSRPFIVEVKKKRGESARQRSIWGNLDLAAIGAETARELTRDEAPVEPAGITDSEPKQELSQLSTSFQELSAPEIAEDAGPAGVEHEAAEVEEPHRNRLSRRRQKDVESLPRAERWKRRLPKVFRRGR